MPIWNQILSTIRKIRNRKTLEAEQDDKEPTLTGSRED